MQRRPSVRFRCPVMHAVAPRRLSVSCGNATLPRRAGAPLPGCQGGMLARRDLPSPYHGAGRGHAAPFSPNRRHPVRLAPFACSKLQAMDIYPFEGQGLPTTTAGTAAKKAARPALSPGDPAVPSPRAAKDAAVSGPSRSGFAPYIPLNGAKPRRRKDSTPRRACASGPATSDTLIVREWGYAWIWSRAQVALASKSKKRKKKFF